MTHCKDATNSCLIGALFAALILVLIYVFLYKRAERFEGLTNNNLAPTWSNNNSLVAYEPKQYKINDIIIKEPTTGLFTTNRKVRIYIHSNRKTARALAYAKQGVYANKTLTRSSPNPNNNFQWEYNPQTGSICHSYHDNLALCLNGNNVTLQVWKNNNPNMQWVIAMTGKEQGSIINRKTGYAIENGGGASSGEIVKAYPMDYAQNKFWSIDILK